MILFVSGRTDIVAFYSTWFMNRYHEGYVDVRNPYYPKQVSRILFEDVDAIVFCTKNPKPLLSYIEEIKQPCIVHVTCTGYKNDIEPHVPNKSEVIEVIHQLSEKIGKDHIYVRYDPILINDTYTVEYHIRAFEKLCKRLEGATERIICSFIDDYKNVSNHYKTLKLEVLDDEASLKILHDFANIAETYGMKIQMCYEKYSIDHPSFVNEVCLSEEVARRLTGKTKFTKWKARDCGCVTTVDIGNYNTCSHLCHYCYANYDEGKVEENRKLHDDSSSLLVGRLSEGDIIKVRVK